MKFVFIIFPFNIIVKNIIMIIIIMYYYYIRP